MKYDKKLKQEMIKAGWPLCYRAKVEGRMQLRHCDNCVKYYLASKKRNEKK
jgi:hypothetical protein